MDVDEVIQLLSEDLQSAIDALQPPFTGQIVFGEGYPSQNFLLQQVAQKGQTSVSIFDRRPAPNMTRWMPFVAVEQHTTPGIAAALSATTVSDGGQIVLTLSGSVKQNDAIALSGRLFSPSLTVGGASAFAGPSQTWDLTTLAAALAAAINADSVMSGWLSAEAAGATVVLTGLTSQPVQLSVAVGNLYIQHIENARFLRELQIIIYANSPANRGVIGKAIMAEIAKLCVNFGLENDAGEWIRIRPSGDLLNDTDASQQLYRRDILVDAEYGITAQQIAWDILSVRPSLTVEQGA